MNGTTVEAVLTEPPETIILPTSYFDAVEGWEEDMVNTRLST
jgi:hypothetical protein